MAEIEPKLTQAQLSALDGSYLADGRHRSEPLPGVTSDARTQAHQDNRELAERIKQALKDAKPGNEGEFLLAWRLYPNADHPRWQQQEPHACGCGCGCGGEVKR